RSSRGARSSLRGRPDPRAGLQGLPRGARRADRGRASRGAGRGGGEHEWQVEGASCAERVRVGPGPCGRHPRPDPGHRGERRLRPGARCRAFAPSRGSRQVARGSGGPAVSEAPRGAPAIVEKVRSETDGEIFALRGIRKRFGFREVLRGVDLTGLPGSSSVIVGPNGAGKSTLLRILAGAMRPTYGDGHVAGFDLKKSAAKARARIGAVFHQSFLRPELTLDENLRFYGELYGRCDRERAAELIDVVGLSRRRGDRV